MGKVTKRKPEIAKTTRHEKDNNKRETPKAAEKKPQNQRAAAEKQNGTQKTPNEVIVKNRFPLLVSVCVVVLINVLAVCFIYVYPIRQDTLEPKIADVQPEHVDPEKRHVVETDMLVEEIEELEKSRKLAEDVKEEIKIPDKTERKEATKKPKEATAKQKKERVNSKLQAAAQGELPAEVRGFEPTVLERLKVRNVSIDGRQLRYREVKPTKDVDTNVRVYLFDNFLTPRECDGLMNAHKRHVHEASQHNPIICFDSIKTLRNHLKDAGLKVKVTNEDFTEGTKCLNASFSSQLKEHFSWSYSTSFYPGESKFSATFEQRVSAATGLKPENGGKFQITSYAAGIGYKTHTDCVVGSREQRDRVATILVYLQDVPEGGETKFTELGIAVKPTRGMAIVWNNMTPDGHCDPTSLHDASKVIKGHKYIIQRWYYYKSFYALGKRSPEPSLPAREKGQPRVSCDEYESCRWYDEWNYDHIVEYEAQKLNLA